MIMGPVLDSVVQLQEGDAEVGFKVEMNCGVLQIFDNSEQTTSTKKAYHEENIMVHVGT